MKMKLISTCLFVIILLLATILRLYRISSVPPSLFADEVDAGYQAQVFNRCQTDYFGNSYPIHFHSFSDWRTSLYIYAISISQKLFGINELSTRLPAAIFGILTIIAIFYLLKQITPKNSRIPLAGLFFSALSPWLIQYSRAAFEVTGMLFCLTLGVAFLLQFVKHSHFKSLVAATIFLSLSVYFYSTAKLFLLLLGIATLIFWSKQIFRQGITKLLLISILIIILLSPLIVDTIRQRAGYRFSYINIFSDPTTPQIIDRSRQTDDVAISGIRVGLTTSLQSKTLHNKPLEWVSKFTQNYLSSFSTNFLFLSGDDNLRHGFGSWGYLLVLDLPLLFIGLSKLKENRNYIFLFVLLLLSPIPFALTRDSNGPHGTRLIIMLPFIITFLAIGANVLSKYLKIAFLLLYLAQFGLFYHYYLIHYPQISARSWHDGIKQTILNLPTSNYSRIYLSDSFEPFLPFFLFWTQYQPTPNSCSPVSKDIIWNNHPGFVGQSISNRYFFGHIEWNQIFPIDNSDFTQTIFVIPSSETNRLAEAINRLNQPKLRYQLHIIKTITPAYETSQEFLILNIIPYAPTTKI